MEILLAESAGFCFGVKRAVDTVYEQIAQNKGEKKIYTYGPIIHNAEVVKELEQKGVSVFEGDDFSKIENQILIIRSHGVPEKIYKLAEKNNVQIVDATCPFVKKIHNLVNEESKKGNLILIAGDSEHPEVQGIIGWTAGRYIVIKNETEAENLNIGKDTGIFMVSQTTFNVKKFNNIVEIINKKGYDMRVINTICNATETRQKEAESISGKVDVMLVVGDKHSSNTQKLYEICRSHCKDTYYIQTNTDLNEKNLQSGISVGITAGASTPNYIIQEVFLTCQKKKISTR